MSKAKSSWQEFSDLRVQTKVDLPRAYVDLLNEQLYEIDKQRQHYPRLFELVFRPLPPRGRRFERKLDAAYKAARRNGDSYA